MPELQFTLPLVLVPMVAEQTPTVVVTVPIVKGVLATIVSVTETPCASDGPLLVTTIVQTAVLPASAGIVSGLHSLVGLSDESCLQPMALGSGRGIGHPGRLHLYRGAGCSGTIPKPTHDSVTASLSRRVANRSNSSSSFTLRRLIVDAETS
jgi:hypothetical protein